MLTETTLKIPFPVTFKLENSLGARRGLLVLHGYTDHAVAARKRLLGTEPLSDWTVLSPNGLFPLPVKAGEGYKPAFAWYFRDFESGREMVSPEFAASVVMGLIKDQKLNGLEWTILGFSQGGFLAPYLRRAGLNVKRIIGVGAAYRPEAYQDLPMVTVDAIHGMDDTIVPYDRSKVSFEALQKMGYGREFHSLPGVAHTMNDEGRALIRVMLEAR